MTTTTKLISQRVGVSIGVIGLLTACSSAKAGDDDRGAATLESPPPTASADDAPTCARPCWFGCPDSVVCEHGRLLRPGDELTGQVTVARGDCAVSASGSTGRSAYYALTLAPQEWVGIKAAPVDQRTDLLILVLPDCAATAALESGRGGGLTLGAATVLVRNSTLIERRAIVVVGRYGGQVEPVTFDLFVEGGHAVADDGQVR